jgi:hypothetical protein
MNLCFVSMLLLPLLFYLDTAVAESGLLTGGIESVLFSVNKSPCGAFALGGFVPFSVLI